MKSFGGRLKEAREAQEVTLDTIASATHIAPRYLDALERSDLEALPGGPFDKGYIRSYAQFLGIDPQPILQAYAAEARQRGRGTPESEQQMLRELSRLVDHGGRCKKGHLLFSSGGMRLALVVLLLAGLAVGAWFLLGNTAPFGHDSGAASRWPEASDSLAQSAASPQDKAAEPASAEEPRLDTDRRAAEAESPLDSQTGQLPSSAVQTGQTEHARGGVSRPAPFSDTQSVERDTPDETASAAESSKSSLSVSELGLGTGIVERNLIGEGDRFPVGTQVWFWTRVVGGQSGEEIRHLWTYGGRTVVNAKLAVGGPHWRTYSQYTLPNGSTGTWTVEARGSDGRVLARDEFICLAPTDVQTRR